VGVEGQDGIGLELFAQRAKSLSVPLANKTKISAYNNDDAKEARVSL
jgi:hypothetical protein